MPNKNVKKPNPWTQHVKKYRSQHPEMKFSDVLKHAAKTYKKK